jgi:hypothetical protein
MFLGICIAERSFALDRQRWPAALPASSECGRRGSSGWIAPVRLFAAL